MTVVRWRKGLLGIVVLAVLAVLAALAGCGEAEPLRIGFIAGTSGRVADLGISGRNAVQLAVDQVNKSGGVIGRQVELLVRDDEQSADLARQRFKELLDAKVAAVIGPMTSSMCAAVLPQANESKVLIVSPTCTANVFLGKDDYLLRVVSGAREYAAASASFQYTTSGIRRAAIVYDLRNREYSEGWANDFKTAFEQLGGRIVSTGKFESGDAARLGSVAEEVLKAGPDSVILIANSVDAALLTQHLRKRSSAIKITSSEWAATERYVELAGSSAEGVVMPQFFDRGSAKPKYLEFRQAYVDRFGEQPGFGSVTAYDAATVLFEAMTRRAVATPKDAVMGIRNFIGLQNDIMFDQAGDVKRDSYFTTVRDGKFVLLQRH